MNCWKTINFTRQYGLQRIFLMSSLTMLITFVLIYIPITYLFVGTAFYDKHFLLFVLGLIFLYPMHKFFHYLPLMRFGKKVKKNIEVYGILPLIHIKVKEPISKVSFLIALFFPFFAVKLLLIGACFLFPHYVHYFTILIAIHVGLCVSDFIFGINILKAPNHSYIEENEEGFEILINAHS